MSEVTELARNGDGAIAVNASEAPSSEIARVAHSIPGRTRMRVAPEMRTPKQMAAIKTKLEQHDDVSSVSVNHRTGSVLIKHSRGKDGHKIFWAAVEDVELTTETVMEVPESGSPYDKLAEGVADQTWAIENFIYQHTGERIHFGVLIPAAIAGLGVYQIVVFGIGLEMLPGPILLWMAYEIMRRLNAEPRFPPRQAAGIRSLRQCAGDGGACCGLGYLTCDLFGSIPVRPSPPYNRRRKVQKRPCSKCARWRIRVSLRLGWPV